MRIEIVTTKRKISKGLVSQMRRASQFVMDAGEVLGFMIKAKRCTYKIALIRHETDYFVIPLDYKKSIDRAQVYRKVGRGTTFIEFSTQEKCDVWWQAYGKVKETATKQIYL